MSACMSGTRGSGVLSSTGDVLVRGVGGVCDMCICLARGGVGGEGIEWMRELGLGFTNPVGTGGVLDMCLCFGCGVLPYFQVTGHPVPISSLGFQCPDCFIWNCSYIVYPSKMKGQFWDSCLRYFYL